MTLWRRFNGQVAGRLRIECYCRGLWWIEYVEVKERYRRRGYATQLLKKATRWADKQHVDLWLIVAPGLYQGTVSRKLVKSLTKLYESVGFKTVRGREMRRRPQI